MWALLTVPVLWLAAVAAYAYEDGMTAFDWMGRFSTVVQRPFAIHWTPHTPKFLLGGLVLYVFAITLYYSTQQNRRPGEEHGSAAWGDVRAIDRKYRDRKHPDRNVILTQHLQMGLNGKQHRRNLLQIIIGGSGAGKTRFLVKPNVMLANASYIVTDPKGEIVRAVGPLLLKRGYVLRVFDLVDPSHSDCYNPFRYAKAFQLLKWAYDQSNTNNWGAYYLGACYAYGRGTQQDYAAARKFLEMVDWNNRSAFYLLGYLYARGLGGPEDIAKGVEYLQKAGDHAEAKEELRHYKKTLFSKWVRR